ncbi:unnamed protein product [Alternaria alternata]
MAPPYPSVPEFPDRMDSLFKPLHYREPALDSLSDGLTSYDPDISPNPTPQDRDISSIPAAQDSKLSSGPYDIQSLPQDHIWIGCTFQDIGEIDLSHRELRDLTYDWSSKEEFSNEGHLGWISQGSSFARVELERFPYMSSNEGFSSKRGLSDFSDMATPELSCSTMTPASSTMTPASSTTTSARSTMTTASSAVDSGYGGSEETRSELSKRQDRHRWPCQFCDKSYIRQGNLLLHERKKHNIHSETAKNIQQEAEARDDRTARSLQSTLGEVSLCKTSPLPHSKEKAHPSSKDEAKLMNYQGHDITDGSDDARVSKKREKPDDDASDCSGAFSSEEGDDSDELEEFNREPNRRGISLECKDAIEKIRNYIDKETRGNKLPVLRDGDIEKLLKQRVDINALKQRVDSNVLLYINGSNTNERTARSELWKWYLIFKRLRPDDELPRNPFIPAQRLVEPEGTFRADALRTFMHVFDQRRMEGCLPQLDDDQRTALNRVFLDTLDMLDANEVSKRHQSIQTRHPRKRRKLPPPEDQGPTPDSTDPTLAPTTPALAPAPIPVELSPSVGNSGDSQHPTSTLPEVQNQLLPQIPFSVPQSFMPSADNLWLLQQQQQPQPQLQQQQEEEAEDAHLLLPMDDLDYINSWTNYEGFPGFGTRDC